MRFPLLSLSRRGKVILACALVLIWIVVHQQISQMDGRFFQPSTHGAQGFVLYLFGDYSRAAKAYRAHFQDEFRSGRTTGDPRLDALLRGDLGAAKQLSRNALEKDPNDVGALLTLGEIALEENAFEQALRLFSDVLKKETEQFDALLLSSLANARSGVYGKAIELFNRAFRYNRIESRVTTFLKAMEATGDLANLPASERPLCLLAHYYRYFRIFDHSNARLVIAYAEKAIASGDRPDDAYLTMGITYEREGKRQKALSAFLKAIELNPTHAYAYRWASMVYSARGDLVNEYRMKKAAFENSPEDSFYASELSQFLENKMGDYHQALALTQRFLETAPDDLGALARMGSLYGSIGDYERSVESYKKALSLAPRNPFLHDGIGYALRELGRIEEAIAAYQTALALKPDLGRAHIQLAYLYRKQRRLPEAIREYEIAFQMQRWEVRYLVDLCTLYHWASEFQRAARCFEQVLSEDPRNTVAQHLLPYTLRNLHQKGLQ